MGCTVHIYIGRANVDNHAGTETGIFQSDYVSAWLSIFWRVGHQYTLMILIVYDA